MSRAARIWFAVAIVAGVIVTFVLVFVRTDIATFKARSESMAPTFDIGDRIAANEEAYDDADPEVGDIVVFHPPEGVMGEGCGAPVDVGALCPEPADDPADVTFVFRVVAGPGDRLRVGDGRAIVDGKPLDEPYVRRCDDPGGGSCTFRGELTIPPDHYFVMGDNRGAADDSRFWGPVPRDRIVGRVDDCTLFGLWCSGKKG